VESSRVLVVGPSVNDALAHATGALDSPERASGELGLSSLGRDGASETLRVKVNDLTPAARVAVRLVAGDDGPGVNIARSATLARHSLGANQTRGRATRP